MMRRNAARNMKSRDTNKIGIQCVFWFHSLGVCLMVPDILRGSNIFIENNPAIPVCQEIFTH